MNFKSLFELIGKTHADITKSAGLFGAALGVGKSLFGVAARNPLKTLGLAATGASTVADASNMNQAMRAGKTMYGRTPLPPLPPGV